MGIKENEIYLVREQQIANRRKSNLLVLSLVLILLVLSSGLGIMWFSNLFVGIFIGAIATAIVVPIQFKLSKIVITKAIGGEKIEDDTEEERYLKVRSQLEGLSIAAGLRRIPDLYVIPTNIPNAFASGMDERTAYIGVTQGLIDIMDDEEVEGVLAHEMAHIMNLDVRLNTVVLSLVTVIGVVAEMLFHRGVDSSDDDSVGGVAIAIVILSLLIAPFARLIGNLIFMGVSRKREFLADATAIRICGYNEGLIRALTKLSERKESYTKREKKTMGGDTMMAMYFNNPGENIENKFSTHPPIEERIRILKNSY